MPSDIDLYQQNLACPIWRGYYSINLTTGLVNVRGQPTRHIFESAWLYLTHLHNQMPRILGNMLADAGRRWGDEYAETVMQASGLKYFTLAQYKSTYDRIPEWIQEKHPTVKHTYCRTIAALSPEQQDDIFAKLENGDFDEPTEDAPELTKEQRVRRAKREAKHEPQPASPPGIPCPFCEQNGWAFDKLQKLECPHCHAKANEILDNYRRLLSASLRLHRTGERTDFDAALKPWL